MMTDFQIDPTFHIDPVLDRLLQQVEELRWTLRYLHDANQAGDSSDRTMRVEHARGHADETLANTVMVEVQTPDTGGPSDAKRSSAVEILAVDAAMLEIANTPEHPLAVVLPGELPFLLADATERHDLLRRVQQRELRPNLPLKLRPDHDRRICAAWDVSLMLGVLATIPRDLPRSAPEALRVGNYLGQVEQHLGRVVRETRWTEAAGTPASWKEIQRLWPQRDTKMDELAELVAATARPIQQLVTDELKTWHQRLPREARTRLSVYVSGVRPTPGAVTSRGATPLVRRSHRPGRGGG